MGSHQHHDRFCGDILLVAAFLMKLNPFFLLIVAKLVCLLLEFFTTVNTTLATMQYARTYGVDSLDLWPGCDTDIRGMSSTTRTPRTLGTRTTGRRLGRTWFAAGRGQRARVWNAHGMNYTAI